MKFEMTKAIDARKQIISREASKELNKQEFNTRTVVQDLENRPGIQKSQITNQSYIQRQTIHMIAGLRKQEKKLKKRQRYYRETVQRLAARCPLTIIWNNFLQKEN